MIYSKVEGFWGVTVNGDKITIRGGSSFDLDNEPLFVVDGTLYEK